MKFIIMWYKSKSIRNLLIRFIENDEKFCNLLCNKYNIIFENIKIFDENLDISNINDERFIDIINLNKNKIKKIIYY